MCIIIFYNTKYLNVVIILVIVIVVKTIMDYYIDTYNNFKINRIWNMKKKSIQVGNSRWVNLIETIKLEY